MRPDLENDDGAFGNKALYAHAFQQLFPGEDIPSEVGTTCCAQFALTKEQVLLRPVWQYEKVRQVCHLMLALVLVIQRRGRSP